MSGNIAATTKILGLIQPKTFYNFSKNIKMKKIIFTIIFLVHALHPFAQTTAFKADECDCKPPSESDIKTICDSITWQEKVTTKNLKYFVYGYEERLMQMAGADVEKDGMELATKKLQCFWDKYKTKFICNFNLRVLSVLKLAFAESFSNFVETLAGTYGLDICFIDKKDGLSLCEYLQKLYNEAVDQLGASHSRPKTISNHIELIEGLVYESCPCIVPGGK